MSFWKKLFGGRASESGASESGASESSNQDAVDVVMTSLAKDTVTKLVHAITYSNQYILTNRLPGLYGDPVMYFNRVLDGLMMAAEKIMPKENVKDIVRSGRGNRNIDQSERNARLASALDQAISIVGPCPDMMAVMHLRAELQTQARLKGKN